MNNLFDTNKLKVLLAGGMMALGFGACKKLDYLKGGNAEQTFTVSSVSPLEGEPGTTVHIKGTGFSTDSTRNKVYVNGKNASILTYSDTSLVITVPETNTVTSQIRVIVDSVPAQDAYTFRYRDVYVAGYVSNATGPSVARLWKNGVVQPFFTDSARFTQAKSVFVDGTDVYVGVNKGYFVNSTFVSVDPIPKDFQQTFVNDIKVHNSSVYASFPTGYTKDGAPVFLFTARGVQTPSVNKMYFDGDSMYVAATLRAPEGGTLGKVGALLFKNDRQILLTPNYRYDDAQSVTVHNSSSIVVGFNFIPATSEIWTDGVGEAFTGIPVLSDILYIGDDQYISSSQSSYYKNGQGVGINIGSQIASLSTTALAASGSDIYGSCTSKVLSSDATDALYFKNTTSFKLAKGDYLKAGANAIAVVVRK